MSKEIQHRERHCEGLQARESEDRKRQISGVAVVFDTPATIYDDGDFEIREIISSEAITKDLLDSSDIKMTMFHNREIILARSNKGEGTLSYQITPKGVEFAFEPPSTAEGEKAWQAVSRGDISGCSFAFGLKGDEKQDRIRTKEGDKTVLTVTLREISAIFDFTLAADPAYPTTECSADLREFVEKDREGMADTAEKQRREGVMNDQLSEIYRIIERKNY